MGTINYKTSEVITLSIEPYENDQDNYFIYENDQDNADIILDKYDFNFYNVTVESGYYEGLQIVIDRNFDRLNDYTEKLETQKELTRLKSCLIELAGVGFSATSPGWCTSYADYSETIKTIYQAVKEERNKIKKIPTINQDNLIYIIEKDLLFRIEKNDGLYQLFLNGVKVGKPQEKRIECYCIAVNYPYR